MTTYPQPSGVRGESNFRWQHSLFSTRVCVYTAVRQFGAFRSTDLEGVAGLERCKDVARRHLGGREAEGIRAGEGCGRGNETGRPHGFWFMLILLLTCLTARARQAKHRQLAQWVPRHQRGYGTGFKHDGGVALGAKSRQQNFLLLFGPRIV